MIYVIQDTANGVVSYANGVKDAVHKILAHDGRAYVIRTNAGDGRLALYVSDHGHKAYSKGQMLPTDIFSLILPHHTDYGEAIKEIFNEIISHPEFGGNPNTFCEPIHQYLKDLAGQLKYLDAQDDEDSAELLNRISEAATKASELLEEGQ